VSVELLRPGRRERSTRAVACLPRAPKIAAMHNLAIRGARAGRWLRALPFLFAMALLPAVAPVPQAPAVPAGPGTVLWEIGIADGRTAEFALAEGRYREFARDGCFAVGRSDPGNEHPARRGGRRGRGRTHHTRRRHGR